MIRAIQAGERVYAAVAPAFVGQFGPKMTPGKLRAAMKRLGFADIIEVAIGADLCAAQEAEDFVEEVPEKLPFMATSCCPAWSMMAKKLFPEQANCISMALTPMTLTARLVKHHQPGAKVAFIGPCAAKKLEAMACPGGCVAGAGTMQSIKKSAAVVGMYAKQAEHQTATGTHHVAELDKLVD